MENAQPELPRHRLQQTDLAPAGDEAAGRKERVQPKTTRRKFISSTVAALASGPLILAKERRRPNVVLVLTDDQGYGDLGCHGNANIKTPHLDVFSRENVELRRFYVCPICNPSRASLLTGQYHYRVGVRDGHQGLAMMYGDAITLAEMLKSAGYRTGIFGKWHLGDNYPMRSVDQGFEESLVYRGGSIGFPTEYPPGNRKFDPTLVHNGIDTKTQGYCDDVFFRAATEFIERNRRESFFVYLATSAPHTPLIVPEEYLNLYRRAELDDQTRRVYAMISNVDDQFGRLMARLRELGLEENTIVVFLSDNGPASEMLEGRRTIRYNAGLREGKGSVYDGGIRVPCIVRWPGRLPAGRKLDTVTAHIDMVPTLLDVCGVRKPEGVALDGRSMMPVLRGQGAVNWLGRTLFFQNYVTGCVTPESHRAYAARTGRYKLVHTASRSASQSYALYDMDADPGEQHDISADRPDLVNQLRKEYEGWFSEVMKSTCEKGLPRIDLGSRFENPVVLIHEGLREVKRGGHWDVNIARSGRYRAEAHFPASEADGKATLLIQDRRLSKQFARAATGVVFDDFELADGVTKLQVLLEQSGSARGVLYARVERIN